MSKEVFMELLAQVWKPYPIPSEEVLNALLRLADDLCEATDDHQYMAEQLACVSEVLNNIIFKLPTYLFPSGGVGIGRVQLKHAFPALNEAVAVAQLPIVKPAYKHIYPQLYKFILKQVVAAKKGQMEITDFNTLWTFVAGTPFESFFIAYAPFSIPLQRFQAHGIIIAPPEHGKTQLLQTFIHGFLKEADPPALVVLDPHGDLFNTLRTRVPPHRLVVFNPEEEAPPLNFFDFKNSTFADALATFNYLMASLSGGLSDKQAGLAPYLLRLIQQIPNPTLLTLKDLMEEKVKRADQSQFYECVLRLSPDDQKFFQNQFYSSTMGITKEAVAWKIAAAVSQDTFKEMFTAPTNSFDADRYMAEKKVVLVKGARTELGKEGMQIFLQFIVSQMSAAAFRRDRIPKEERHLCLLIADEAEHVFNTQSASIMTECRKYGLGALHATQVIQQIPADVRAAVYGATAIKIAGAVANSDANIMAAEMYATGEFLRSCRSKPGESAEWAFYSSGMPGLTSAIKLTVPYGTLEKEPQYAQPPRKPKTKKPPVKEAPFTTSVPSIARKVHSHRAIVSFPEFKVQMPGLLDSGATRSLLPCKYEINGATVRFQLGAHTVERPVLRMVSMLSFTETATEHPIVSVIMALGEHIAIEEIALSSHGGELLVGRSFMAGRILVDPSQEKVKNNPGKPRTPSEKTGEPRPEEDRDSEY